MENDRILSIAGSVLRAADQATAERRLISAISLYEKLLPTLPEEVGVIACFNLATLHFFHTGRGEEARKLYEKIIALYMPKQAGITEKRPQKTLTQMPEIVANSCENMMLLSLSYEEYAKLDAILRDCQSQNDTMEKYGTRVAEARERSYPWSQVMFSAASLMGDPEQDNMRYGNTASILRLLLKNRLVLRLSKQDWRIAVVRYSAAVLLTADECILTASKSARSTPYAEFAFIIKDAIPLVQEYVQANSNDADGQKALASLLETSEAFGSSGSGGPSPMNLKTLTERAFAYKNSGDFFEAEKVFLYVLENCGDNPVNRAATLSNLGHLYRQMGRYNESRSCYEEALSIEKSSGGPENALTIAVTLNNMAALYTAQKNFPKAIEYLSQAAEIRRRVLGPDHPKTIKTLQDLAELRRAAGRF